MNLFDTELEEEVETVDGTDVEKKLVVYNDDFNTFEHVIKCIIRYCGQSEEVAMKLTLNIHTKGLAIVKEGTKTELYPVRQALNENGLNAKIED